MKREKKNSSSRFPPRPNRSGNVVRTPARNEQQDVTKEVIEVRKIAYALVVLCACALLFSVVSCDRQKMMDRLMQDPQAVDQLVKSITASPEALPKMMDSIFADKTSTGTLMDKIVGDPNLAGEMIGKLSANAVTSDQFLLNLMQDPEKVAKIKAMLKKK